MKPPVNNSLKKLVSCDQTGYNKLDLPGFEDILAQIASIGAPTPYTLRNDPLVRMDSDEIKEPLGRCLDIRNLSDWAIADLVYNYVDNWTGDLKLPNVPIKELADHYKQSIRFFKDRYITAKAFPTADDRIWAYRNGKLLTFNFYSLVARLDEPQRHTLLDMAAAEGYTYTQFRQYCLGTDKPAVKSPNVATFTKCEICGANNDTDSVLIRYQGEEHEFCSMPCAVLFCQARA